MCFAPKPPVDNSAEIARQQEAARQARITEGRTKIDDAFSQFNDPFYAAQTQSYNDYYLPQLQDQFEKARKTLITTLARTGNLNSGAGATREADLEKADALQRGAVANQAIDYGNQTRTNVENARSDLYQQNQAAADPSAAGASAVARVGSLSTPPALNPLGQVFSDFLNLGTTGLALESKGYPGLKTGLFPAPRNAQTIVN